VKQSLHSWAKTLEKQLKTIKVGTYDEKQMIDLLTDGVAFCQSICPKNDMNSGDLERSITFSYDKINRIGYIYSDLPPAESKNTNYGLQYIVYLEYGTGIYSDFANGRMDGWTYYNKKHDKFYFTKGQEPNPIMYNTTEYLKGLAPKGIKVTMKSRNVDRGE